MAERKSREYYDRIRKYFKERGYKTKKYVCKFPNERGKQVYSDTTYVYSNKNVIVCIVAPPKTRTKCIIADRRDSLNEYSIWVDISNELLLEYFIEDYDTIPTVIEAVQNMQLLKKEK